jgi:hypothetical protein
MNNGFELDDGGEELEVEATLYEVFNPDQTVGVACDREGAVVGLHVDDDILDNGDEWVTGEIMRVAKLAYEKSRVGLRTELERNGTDPFVLRSFGLPTDADYVAMENDAFDIRQE